MLKFKLKLREINWNDVITTDKNINENYEAFNEILINILNQCIPLRKYKLQSNFNKYWLTKGIKQCCKNKRLLKILITKTKNPILTKYYRKYEKILKKTVVTAKKQHFKHKMIKSSNKVKTMWSIINERTNKKERREKQNIVIQTNNNNMTSEPKEVANIFNNFFASIGKTSTSPSVSKPKNTSIMSSTENSIFLSPVDPYEVNTLIKNLKNKSSYGVDELPPTLLKKCAEELGNSSILPIGESIVRGRCFSQPLEKSSCKANT